VLPAVAAGELSLAGDPADDRLRETIPVAGCFAGDFYRLTTNSSGSNKCCAKGERIVGTPLGRQISFSVIHSPSKIPLGNLRGAEYAEKGFWAVACLVLDVAAAADPLKFGCTIWQIFGRVDIGLVGYTLICLGDRL